MRKILLLILLSAFFLLLLFFYQTATITDKRLHIVFCDVGQGDAIYIRTPSSVDILVDGGRDSRVLDCLANNMPFWDRKIELVFATHPDADHIAGLNYVLESYEVGNFYSSHAEKDTKVYQALRSLIAKNNIAYREIYVGSKFTLEDGVTIETFWPTKDFSAKDINDYSLVQYLKYGQFDLLLTGDVSSYILDTIDLSRVSFEVFKLPHHGSKTGIDESTFERINADLGIISAGKNNSYHHPHESVLSILKKNSIKYLRTDILGEIEFATDGINTEIIN